MIYEDVFHQNISAKITQEAALNFNKYTYTFVYLHILPTKIILNQINDNTTYSPTYLIPKVSVPYILYAVMIQDIVLNPLNTYPISTLNHFPVHDFILGQ